MRLASHDHRERHGFGCTVYPTSSGPLLTVLAAATNAEHVLEVGCGLGYSALCLAHGASGPVETIEQDPEHVRLAEQHIEHAGFGARIRILPGKAADVLQTLDPPYDLAFSDVDPEEMPVVLDHLLGLLQPGGLLVSANLFLAQFVADLAHADRMAEYRRRVVESDRLRTAFAPGGLALSVVEAE